MDPLQTFDALVRAETRLWNGLDRELGSHGCPPLGRTHVLRVVAAAPGCRVQDVARAVDITHGGASKLVDRLVADGLLARAAHPTDGRASLLVVTDAGGRVLDVAQEVARAWLAPRLAGTGARRSLADHLARTDALLDPPTDDGDHP